MSASVVYVVDRETSAFQRDRMSVDVVAPGTASQAGITSVRLNSWPYRTYPEFLLELCEPQGLRIANGGIAGEISENGVGQVRDYLGLFPNAQYFVVGYGTNDLGMWPDVEATSRRIIENLGRMVAAIRNQGREPILFNVPYANESLFPETVAQELHRHRDYHNEHLRQFCEQQQVPLADICSHLGDEHFADELHPNSEGAKLIAEQVYRVLLDLLRSD